MLNKSEIEPLSFSIIGFNDNEICSLMDYFEVVESTNGSGFLCCTTVVVEPGKVYISIPF